MTARVMLSALTTSWRPRRGDRTHYTVTADGQRFLLRKVLEEKAPSPMTVVLHWASEGKK
jgi:DNA-binding PadR family transcriptional regulator